VLADLAYLISQAHRKSLIPSLEKISGKVKGKIQLYKEVRFCVESLMAETLSHSMKLMDQCNKRVNIERARSMERIRQQRSRLAFSFLEN